MPIRDITGQKFGRLLILNLSSKKTPRVIFWDCICDCGVKCTKQAGCILSGNTKSCGCLQIERRYESVFKHGCGKNSTTRTVEYNAWSNMKDRCNNESNKDYRNYGGKGISVCKKWNESFLAFLEDMGLKPSKKLSLDRIDSNGNYEPSNCRWASWAVQSRNRKDVIFYEKNGKKLVIKDWADLLNSNPSSLCRMIHKRGFDVAHDYYYQKNIEGKVMPRLPKSKNKKH